MTTRQQSARKRIIAAAAEDAISSALPGTSTAITAVSLWTQSKLPWISPSYFLNDDASWSIRFYPEERDRLLQFRRAKTPYYVPQVIVIDNTLSRYTLGDIKFRVDRTVFQIGAALVGRSEPIVANYRRYLKLHGCKFYDSQLLRLQSLEDTGTEVVLTVQPVNYEAESRTQLCIDAKASPNSESIREIVHSHGALEPIGHSSLPDAIGINCLFITADGRAVMPMRTRRVAIRPNQLSPTASGALVYSDAQSGGSLESMHLLREAFEELRFEESSLGPGALRFLGMTRELARGGKPELFFVGNCNLTQAEMEKMHGTAPDRYEYVRRYGRWVFWDFGSEATAHDDTDDTRFALRIELERLLDRHGHEMSLPLLTNIVLWLKSKGVFT